MIKTFLGDESGATAIEYALLLSLIAVALVGGWEILGESINSLYTDISDLLAYAIDPLI